MRARKYNKKIELWQTSKVFDSYSNYATTPELIDRVWCRLVTKNNAYKVDEFGKTSTTNEIVIELRKRSDFDYLSKNLYFVYQGHNYIPVSQPVNIDFEEREIRITLELQPNGSFTSLTPINTFDNTFDSTFK